MQTLNKRQNQVLILLRKLMTLATKDADKVEVFSNFYQLTLSKAT
jgi:hypothetical protein